MKHRYLILLLLLLFGAYLLTAVTFIRPGERAVVRRFGRVLDRKPAPGLWVGLPWGIDRLDRVPVNLVRRVEVGYQKMDQYSPTTPPGQLLTGDHNLVNVRVVIHYTVNPDDDELVNYVLQADRADGLVSRSVEAALAEWTAGRRIDDLLIRGKADLPAFLLQHIQRRIDPYHLGIHIQDASVAHLLPPDEVKSAFDDVTRAQTNIATRVHDAMQEAARELRKAQQQRYEQRQQALAYADTERRQARADAQRFDERRQKYWRLRQANPDILAAIWWEEMGKLFTTMKQNGHLDLLDNHIGADGLDITVVPPLPKK